MSVAAATVPQGSSAGKLRLFAARGGFMRRVDRRQADELIAAGLAEWRGSDLRMIELERYRRGLNGAATSSAFGRCSLNHRVPNQQLPSGHRLYALGGAYGSK